MPPSRPRRADLPPDALLAARERDRARYRAQAPRCWVFCPTCGHRSHRPVESISEPCGACGAPTIVRPRGRPRTLPPTPATT